MSNQNETGIEGKSVGRLTGKTTIFSATLLITDPKVSKSNYFVIYGDNDEEGKNEYYILSILDIWKDAKGLMANLKVLGERPERPFDVGAEVYLASDDQIINLLGINNPPEKSVSVGTLLSYPFNVNLLVKNIGRLFITGKSGSGKSYTMGVICEEFLKKGIPIVILDRHGEYGSLKVASEDLEVKEPEIEKIKLGVCPWCGESIPMDAKKCELCGKELESEILESGETELKEKKPIKPKKAGGAQESEYVDNIIEFADLNVNKGGDIDLEYLFSLNETDIVAARLCSIINLRGLDLEIQELIAGKLLKKLYTASVARKIPPFYLFLDEAHLFAGKKQTETCDAVKLFAQEGRKFGANIVIGTQRPQLLDTTIRAQSGTWIVHNLTDIRDIDITISSAEDLSKENKDDISGLEPGQAIICGEAVKGIPLFIQVRKRRTKHGGTGFNPLDFLSEQTVEESQKRKQRILAGKSADEIQAGKTIFQEMKQPKAAIDYLEEISALKIRIKELESEVDTLKHKYTELEQTKGVAGKAVPVNDKIKELETEVKVWKEKYNYFKESSGKIQAAPQAVSKAIADKSETVLNLQNKIIELEAEVKKYKSKYTEAMLLAEKSISELKKKK